MLSSYVRMPSRSLDRGLVVHYIYLRINNDTVLVSHKNCPYTTHYLLHGDNSICYVYYIRFPANQLQK